MKSRARRGEEWRALDQSAGTDIARGVKSSLLQFELACALDRFFRPSSARVWRLRQAGLVKFFLDNDGFEELADRVLQRSPPVVGRVNLSCQGDEIVAKIAPRLMFADGSFRIPKQAIDQT